MNQSPYTPPRIPPKNQASKQSPKASWARRIALGIIELTVATLSPFILVAWVFGLFMVGPAAAD